MGVIAKAGVAFRDARGQVGRTQWWYSFDDTIAANSEAAINQNKLIATDIAALSNGLQVSRSGLISAVMAPEAYGDTDVFQNVEDKATLTFVSLAGVLFRLSIPAPVATLFMADSETVDLANADLVTLVGHLTTADASGGRACIKRVAPVAGNADYLSDIVAGARTRRRFQRKTTLWTKTPDETGPEE